jgi:hypothetical protein
MKYFRRTPVIHILLYEMEYFDVYITYLLSGMLFIKFFAGACLYLYPSLLKGLVVVNHATMTFKTVHVS